MKKNLVKEIIEWIACILIAIILALIIRYFIMTLTIVNHSSMFPTIEEKERLILNRTVRGDMPNRGEIITFEAPSKKISYADRIDINNPVAIYDEIPQGIFRKFIYYVLEIGKYSYIKRVIALPGEHIKIENGRVYINDIELKEEYLQDGIITESKNFNDIIVPDGYIFVMGDNREYSMDSREFGCIPISKIEGKAVFRFWPFNKWGNL